MYFVGQASPTIDDKELKESPTSDSRRDEIISNFTNERNVEDLIQIQSTKVSSVTTS